MGLDGSGVPALPSETTGRKGKDGGRATKREAKAGVIWVVEPDGEGGMRLVENSMRHFATIESAEDDERGDSPVARRMLRELAALGFYVVHPFNGLSAEDISHKNNELWYFTGTLWTKYWLRREQPNLEVNLVA